VDKKSPIIKTIRRQKDASSDIFVQKKGQAPEAAESFFVSQGAQVLERRKPGDTVQWTSFCGLSGKGIIIDRHPSVGGALMVRITHPAPAEWRKAGVPANPGDSCVVFEWQITESVHI